MASKSITKTANRMNTTIQSIVPYSSSKNLPVQTLKRIDSTLNEVKEIAITNEVFPDTILALNETSKVAVSLAQALAYLYQHTKSTEEFNLLVKEYKNLLQQQYTYEKALIQSKRKLEEQQHIQFLERQDQKNEQELALKKIENELERKKTEIKNAAQLWNVKYEQIFTSLSIAIPAAMSGVVYYLGVDLSNFLFSQFSTENKYWDFLDNATNANASSGILDSYLLVPFQNIMVGIGNFFLGSWNYALGPGINIILGSIDKLAKTGTVGCALATFCLTYFFWVAFHTLTLKVRNSQIKLGGFGFGLLVGNDQRTEESQPMVETHTKIKKPKEYYANIARMKAAKNKDKKTKNDNRLFVVDVDEENNGLFLVDEDDNKFSFNDSVKHFSSKQRHILKKLQKHLENLQKQEMGNYLL